MWWHAETYYLINLAISDFVSSKIWLVWAIYSKKIHWRSHTGFSFWLPSGTYLLKMKNDEVYESWLSYFFPWNKCKYGFNCFLYEGNLFKKSSLWLRHLTSQFEVMILNKINLKLWYSMNIILYESLTNQITCNCFYFHVLISHSWT